MDFFSKEKYVGRTPDRNQSSHQEWKSATSSELILRVQLRYLSIYYLSIFLIIKEENLPFVNALFKKKIKQNKTCEVA